MNRFLQLHLLTSYGPANLNRDDSGRPKTAVMGGAVRLRISSQSLKRAWRTAEVFEQSLAAHLGTRTKLMGVNAYATLVTNGVSGKDALAWAGKIAEQFGKRKKENKDKPLQALEIEQLAHFSPEERAAIDALLDTLAAEKRAPADDELKLLRSANSAVDIALFGRMLADSPGFNVEAAAQVAHAIAVHKCQVEDDFFTAVDDLNTHEEDAGASHMGSTEFGAAVFYLYLCIDRHLLLENLDGRRDLADRALQALLESAATIAPTGKQNSFASRARASYVLAEKGDQQPRSLAVAFLKPAAGEDLLDKAITLLDGAAQKMDQVYGPCAAHRLSLNAQTAEGSLAALKTFVMGD